MGKPASLLIWVAAATAESWWTVFGALSILGMFVGARIPMIENPRAARNVSA